jgi:hypothetical protein
MENKIKEKDEKVKSLFGKLGEIAKQYFEAPTEEEPKTSVEMTEATLKDGTKIKVSGDIAQGSKILIVAEDGSEMPAPNGEHILDDGSIINVTDGIIDSVVPAEGEADDSKVGMEEEFSKLKVSYSELEAKYKSLLESSETKFKEIDSLKQDFAKMKNVQKATYDVIESIAGMPAEETKVEEKPNYNFKKQSTLDAIIKAKNELKFK